VYYSKPDVTESNDYLVDHTIIVYLLDTEGNFAAYYGQNTNADDMAKSIAKHIKNTTGAGA
jgi:protein SCO1/2